MRRVPVVLVPVFAAGCGVPAAFAPGSAFAHTSYLIGFGTLVALGWARLRSLSGPQRSGYAFIVAALTVWLVGDLLQDVLRWLIGPAGDVSPADLLWISGYPLLGVGLIKLVRLRAPTRLRVWSGPDRIVVAMTDGGAGPKDPYAGLLPIAEAGPGGRGLWIVNQSCNHVTMTRNPDGFTLHLTAGVPH